MTVNELILKKPVVSDLPSDVGLGKVISFNETPKLNYNDRCFYTTEFSWGSISQEQIEILSKWLEGKSLIEVMSGTGYLSYQLNKMSPIGFKHVAYDNRSWTKCKESNFHKPFFGSKKNCFMAPIKKFDVVLMVWPMYDVNHAYRIANKMISGQYLIYQGEHYGGCCADDQFFDLLESEFEEVIELTEELNEYQVKWCSDYGSEYIHEEFMVMKKK